MPAGTHQHPTQEFLSLLPAYLTSTSWTEEQRAKGMPSTNATMRPSKAATSVSLDALTTTDSFTLGSSDREAEPEEEEEPAGARR